MLTVRQLAIAAVPAFFLAGALFATSSENAKAETPPAETPESAEVSAMPETVENAETPAAVPEKPTAKTNVIPLTYTRFAIGKDGKVRYENANISFEDITIQADTVDYDTELKTAHASGGVSVNLEAMRFLTDSVAFDQNTGQIRAKDIRGGVNPFYFSAEEIYGTADKSEEVTIVDSITYFGEPHWSSVSFSAGKMYYNREEDWLHLSPSLLRVAGVPVLPLPPLSVPRLERPPVRVWANSGNSSAPGFFARTTTHLTIWDHYEPGMLLDFYERSGPLIGPALAYDTRKANDSPERWMFGDFQSGYINDTTQREDDIFKNPIGGKRGFINWFHKQQIDRLEVTGVIHKWSDSQVMRNFRPDIYEEDRQPDNFFEFVVPDRDYYLSALTRLRLNDFQSAQQRLPEIRLDMMPHEIKNTGIYQRFSASYAYLLEENSDEYRLQQTNDGDELKSSRADFYYGLDAPIKFGEIATFTPVVGVRSTFYGNTVPDADETYWRTLGQIGFDLQFLATGVSDYTNETWKIDGFRHVLRPIFQYRYLPGVASQSSRIPQIDREIYRDAPTILDLGEKRAVDQIYDEHVFRIGLENLFQTRDKEYGSKNLAELNIYQDIRKTERPVDNRRLSDNFVNLKISPASWISFSLTHRMDVYSFDTKTLSASVKFTDGDLWFASFTSDYLYNDDLAYYDCKTRARQHTIEVGYKLNSYWEFFGDWRYDDEKNIFTDQYYGFRQRLGNSWTLEYYVRHQKDARDENDFSFGFALSLFAY